MVLHAYMLIFLHTFCPGKKFDFLNCLRKIGCLPVQTADFIHTFCPIARVQYIIKGIKKPPVRVA